MNLIYNISTYIHVILVSIVIKLDFSVIYIFA